jgi:hypothetical protein
VNPINMSRVERNAANILRALIEFIPGGALITQAMANHGIFEKVGAWVEEQIQTLGMSAGVIKDAISRFLDSLGWSDVFNLSGVWERAKRIFTEPIDRILNFAKGLVSGIVKFIKDAILIPLARLAEGTEGYDLLKGILGKDPITDAPVERSAETLVRPFMKLIGQEEVWENMKKANAIPRAWAWFQGAMTELKGFVAEIPSLFVAAFRALELVDIVVVPRAFAKLARVFGGFLGRFASWAGNAVWTLLQIIFECVAPGAVPYIKKAAGAFKSILKNPIGFVKNLVAAGKLGFQQFADKFGGYLKASLIEWLTGSMPSVYIPKSFEFLEIIKFVLSVLGLTWQNIRQKLVKAVGETTVKAMETGFKIVVTLVTEGPAAAWEQIKQQLSDLKDTVVNAIVNFVVESVVVKAVTKVISLLIPGAAFIQAIVTIYDTIMVFVEKLQKIFQVVKAFLDSIIAITEGAIAGAANKVESTLAGLLTLAISFLAGFAGLGKVADKVMNIINTKVRMPIDKALDKVVDWIVTMAKKFVGKVKSAAAGVLSWWKMRKNFTADGEPHSLSFAGEKKAARLVVASSTQDLEAFLKAKASEEPKDPKKVPVIAAIDPLVKQVKTAEALPEDQYETAQKQIEGLMNQIGVLLVDLLTGSEIGTKGYPLPLEYTKRRAGTYPVIYIGPKSSDRIPQQLLRDDKKDDIEKLMTKPNERKAWVTAGRPIRKYLPTKEEPLPDGPTIGLRRRSSSRSGRRSSTRPARPRADARSMPHSSLSDIARAPKEARATTATT